MANLLYLPFWFNPQLQSQALSTKDILMKDRKITEDADDAKNNSIRNDQIPEEHVASNVTGSWILSERESVEESRSNNGTNAEEGTKKRHRRKKKEKRKEKAAMGRREAYNESKLNEEWEDYIFKRWTFKIIQMIKWLEIAVHYFVMVVMVRLEENQRQIDNEQEYEKAILESYYDDADEQ